MTESEKIIYSKDYQYSFDISDDLESKEGKEGENNVDNSLKKRFYFTLKNDKPIKLGDGTYGIVYQAHNQNEREFAVKLLYTQNDSDTLELSYRQEMKSAKEIRQKLRENNNQEKFYGIIEMQGGTSKFHESAVFNNSEFKKQFENLRVSSYAIVMPKYTYTLKDILEERKIDKNQRVAGYRLIRSWPFETRVKQIVPFLRSIAEGIKTLHSATKFHLDLKPANIFVNKMRAGLDVVVGDLGFLNYESATPSGMKNVTDYLPLGTRHYRSPEQKDYFDICDVEILGVDKDITLKINDQKFKDTIIEPGDRLVFSKLGHEIDFDIVEFEKSNDFIIITVENLNENNSLENQLIQNEITQVVLYKRQQYRTDLFGIGAIAFDMLTGGLCPEIFYDSIRSYDHVDEDANNIINLYNQVASLQSDQPDLARLFQPFRKSERSTEYAPREIVELILKCILYKAKNSYFDLAGDKPQRAIELVTEELNKLEDIYQGSVRINPLIIDGIGGGDTNESEEESTFEEQLKKIQYLSDQSQFIARLYYGTGYFFQLVGLVDSLITEHNRELNDKNNDLFSFADLRPNNILVSNNSSDSSSNFVNLKRTSYIYRRYSKYIDDLKNDYVYAKIKNQNNDPFVPDELVYMRRHINLEIHNEESRNDEITCKYSFLDKSPFGNCVQKGDWIIEQSDDIANTKLWEISSFSDDLIVLKYIPQTSPDLGINQSNISAESSHEEIRVDNSSEESNLDVFSNEPENDANNPAQEPENDANNSKLDSSKDNIEFIYYKKLNVCRYYYYMMGIYLYQIFFNGVNSISDNNYRSLNLIKNRIYYYDKRDTDFVIFSNNISYKQDTKNPSKNLDKILNQLVKMYLKLTLYEAKDSYYSELNNLHKNSVTNSFSDDCRDLDNLLYQFFNKKNYTVNSNDYENLQTSMKKIQINIDPSNKPKLSEFSKCEKKKIKSFDELIQNIIDNRVPQNPFINLWNLPERFIG